MRLINVLNQESIDLEEYCCKSGKRKASSNAAEENLQSSTKSGNNNIDTQTNNMVVDNDIQRQASRQEHVEDNEVQRQASRQESGHVLQNASKRQRQRDNTKYKKRAKKVKGSVEFLK